MSETLENIPEELQPDGAKITEDADAPQIKVVDIEGIGEVMVGHGDAQATLMLVDCARNDPTTNQILLASNLKFTDRITGTKIFPREGMAMPEGKSYIEKVKE